MQVIRFIKRVELLFAVSSAHCGPIKQTKYFQRATYDVLLARINKREQLLISHRTGETAIRVNHKYGLDKIETLVSVVVHVFDKQTIILVGGLTRILGGLRANVIVLQFLLVVQFDVGIILFFGIFILIA